MKAVVVDRWMQPGELTLGEAPDPVPEPGMLTVEVHAAGCNFADILLVQGNYQMKPPFPFIPGSELAGVVKAVGAGVEGFTAGDRVMGSVLLGAFAEQVNMPAAVATRMPAGMSFEEGGAFPIVYGTSHAALVYRARLREGETVLVTAAAGGVGLSSVQIAKALGARVIALAGGEEKLAVATQAGADVVIDYRDGSFVDAVKAATGGRGVDVVIENVGGDVFDQCMKCMAWDGRLVVVGFAGGRIPEVKVNRVLLKQIAVVGVYWGMMLMNTPHIVMEGRRELAKLYEAGKIKPVVWKRFALADTGAALDALASRKSWGKIVVGP